MQRQASRRRAFSHGAAIARGRASQCPAAATVARARGPRVEDDRSGAGKVALEQGVTGEQQQRARSLKDFRRARGAARYAVREPAAARGRLR